MAFGHRVRGARIEKGMTQQQLADGVGVNQPVIGSIESRDSETSKHASKIADALSVNLDWLLTGKNNKSNLDVRTKNTTYDSEINAWDESTPLLDDEVELPFYSNVHVAAGHGAECEEVEPSRKLRFSKRSLRDANVNSEDAIVIKVVGDSMERLILDGATIAVDTSKANVPIKDNRIYALESDGDLRCKYIQRVPGGKIKLISENPMYDDELYEIDEFSKLYRIIGWVFWWSTLAKW
ncbi:MAG: helix-turn-helix transcriptional regulator [Psychrobacter sp.]